MELAQMLTFDTDVETLKNDIYNIFVRDFDAGTFDKSPQECGNDCEKENYRKYDIRGDRCRKHNGVLRSGQCVQNDGREHEMDYS